MQRTLWAACALLILLTTPWPVWAQYPQAVDVASPEAIVAAAYQTLIREPGANFQWDRFRSLFLPQARLIPNTEQTGGAFRVFSPEEFIAWVDAYYAEHAPIGGPDDKGFAEEPIANHVQRYGDTAQVFSSYQKHFWGDDHILGRGINSYQLVYHDERWWIVSIVWDEENGAGPIPEEMRNDGYPTANEHADDTDATMPMSQYQTAEHAINETLTAWASAIREADLDTIAALVTEDAVFWTHGEPPLNGREALKQAFRPYFIQYEMRQDFHPEELLIFDDHAFMRGFEVNRLISRNGGEAMEVKQRAFSMLRRGSDGRWRFARGMTNLPPGED